MLITEEAQNASCTLLNTEKSVPSFSLWESFLVDILYSKFSSFDKCFGVFSASVKRLKHRSLTKAKKSSHLSKFKKKLKKCEWTWFVENYFLFNYFPGRLSTTTPDNQKQKLNVAKVIKVVINEFDRKPKSYQSRFINWYRFC